MFDVCAWSVSGSALALGNPVLAFAAHRLSTGSGPPILSLNIVSRVAVRADVMDVTLGRVPCRLPRHCSLVVGVCRPRVKRRW